MGLSFYPDGVFLTTRPCFFTNCFLTVDLERKTGITGVPFEAAPLKGDDSPSGDKSSGFAPLAALPSLGGAFFRWRTDGPYGPSVRTVRTDGPYGPSVRTVRTDRPYGPSVRETC